MQRLFRQFSFPGGIPSHVAPEVPGSIHEGGELGYALSHAYGAAFDNPDLLVACVIGDGEAETGPLAGQLASSNVFLNPARDGAVLPILHLNGYKIANPTVLARIPDDDLLDLMRGYGYQPYLVAGDDPTQVHQRLAATLDRALDEIAAIQRRARSGGRRRAPPLADDRAAHPEGLDRPGARSTASRSRAPSAPTRCRSPRCATTRSTWPSWSAGCAATGRRSSSTPTGAPVAELTALPPRGERRMSANPARQRRAGAAGPGPARLPRLRGRRAPSRASRWPSATRVLGAWLRDVITANPQTFRLFGPGRGRLQPARRGVRGHRPGLRRPDRARRRPPRPGRPGDGGALRAPLPGLAGGLPAHRPARPVHQLRGVHPHRRLDGQPARQVAEGRPGASRGGGRSPR